MNREDEWGRLRPQGKAGNRAGVYTMGQELRAVGITPTDLGLVNLGAALRRGDEQIEIPVLSDLALSLAVPGEVSIIRGKANPFRRNYPVLATGEFTDEHPKDWTDALAKYDQALLVFTPAKVSTFATIGDWRKEWHVALVPVLYTANDDGFSMLPPGLSITGDLVARNDGDDDE
jgi:hypothetical protein